MIKKEFPMFAAHPELVYLDTAATALTPQSVIDAMCGYYTTFNANVARGLYRASTEATEACENARARVATFIGVADPACVIFTSGTTMSLNMIATGLTPLITAQHNIVTTLMEHHANFIPWQRLCHTTGADFRIASLTDDGIVDSDSLLAHIDDGANHFIVAHVEGGDGVMVFSRVREHFFQRDKSHCFFLLSVRYLQRISMPPVRSSVAPVM